MKSLSLGAVGLGLVLVLGSVLWGIIFSPAKTWTDEKNERMNSLGIEAHKLGGELDVARRRPSMHGRSATAIEAEYKKTTDELTQLKEEFQDVQQGPKTMSSVLRWTGIVFVLLGGMTILSNRN
jgi:hypothetical protein